MLGFLKVTSYPPQYVPCVHRSHTISPRASTTPPPPPPNENNQKPAPGAPSFPSVPTTFPSSPTEIVTFGGRLPPTRRLVVGALGFTGLALGANFLGSTSALLGLVEEPSRSARLDVLFPIKGYKRCYDVANGFEFLYPAAWVGDQLLLYRAAERREREVSLDLPPLPAGPPRARRGAMDPVAAFGPVGGSGELNVSVVVAPVAPGFRLERFGSAEAIGERILSNVIAPEGSGRKASLISASERTLGGVFYVTLEYAVQGPTFSRHNLAVCAVKNGKLYTINAQSPAASWPEVSEPFAVVAETFRVLDAI